VHNEFSINNTAGRGRIGDGLDHGINPVIRNPLLQYELGQKIHNILRATVQLGVPFLAAKATNFGHGHSLDTGFRDRIADVIQFERFYDCGNHLHLAVPWEQWMSGL